METRMMKDQPGPARMQDRRHYPILGVFGASLVALVLIGADAPAAPAGSEAPASVADPQAPRLVVPPPMPHRSIPPPTEPIPGTQTILRDGDTTFCLYLPDGWKAPADGTVELTANFHAAVWFVIEEHLRRGLDGPLLCFYLGQGSSVYRRPFEDRERLGRILRQVEAELVKRGAPPGTRIGAVDLSSFSAGYGAVRELVQSPDYFRLIRRIVLGDSMYGSLETEPPTGPDAPEPKPQASGRRPLAEHIEVWVPFAQAAMRGEKTFAFTYSQVPTATYASSAECAAALIEAVGAPLETVAPGSIPAADDPQFPLRSRSDAGCVQVWSYGGEDAQAHMTHARHMAEGWLALDAAGDP